MNPRVKKALKRLEREVELWRDEPMKLVAARSRAMRPLRIRQFHAFGPDAIIDRPAWLYGPHKMAIGAGALIMRGCWLSVEKSGWDLPAPVLDIGDRSGMRMGCTISAALSVVIEDDVIFGAQSTVIDHDHTWADSQSNVLGAPLRAVPVRVGRGTWVADRVAIVAGAEIGEHCVIGANSVVTGAIPDHAIAVGAPARVVGSTKT
jgi:carbonic anhydrase/acetyltransferase-like protein (isoleucine patch superfamily)